MKTFVNVIPGGGYLIIEAWNGHCSIRVAEKDNYFIYRLIKTSARLHLRTAIVRLKNILK